uniref:Uncharacterized protein n=1 Tax=Dromaius novaehollandiae TaxID=8790 RepID=A0A8C4J374_DRONO
MGVRRLRAHHGPKYPTAGTARGPAVSAAAAPPRREPLLPAAVRLALPGRGEAMAASEENGGGNGSVEEKENGKKRRLGAVATAWLIFYNVAMTPGGEVKFSPGQECRAGSRAGCLPGHHRPHRRPARPDPTRPDPTRPGPPARPRGRWRRCLNGRPSTAACLRSGPRCGAGQKPRG